jgi:ketosteroid isomerase-like protein
MSKENVEIVRRYYEVFSAWLEGYWADPGPIGNTPGSEEVVNRLHPDVEWDWLLSPQIFRGRDQVLRAVADWIETMDDWRVELQELIDGRGDRVLAIVRVMARGKGSGVPVDQRSFTAITLRDGKIIRIEEHTERAKGLEAAGLRE